MQIELPSFRGGITTVRTFDWTVTSVLVTDGDTVRLGLERELPIDNDFTATIHNRHLAKGTPIRLIILDTPERGDSRWSEARQTLLAWVAERAGGLRCQTYESAGWDRLLGDLYHEADRGDTATQYMLKAGFDPYLKEPITRT